MALALTYDEVKALEPCPERWSAVSRALGGKAGWNGKQIDAATARAAGITFDDLVWVASAVARADADVERRLRLWMADCAVHVLHIYERAELCEKAESPTAPRRAIIAARAFARGEIDDAARAAAQAAAQAAAGAAAWAAAWEAARDAAWDAEGAAARAAAQAAAWEAAQDSEPDAAWGAAQKAAWEAALAAARAAARAAAQDSEPDAAWEAARDAEEAWQFDRLVAWLSLDEPDDYPLPDRIEVSA